MSAPEPRTANVPPEYATLPATLTAPTSCDAHGGRGGVETATPLPRSAIDSAPFDALLCSVIVATRVPAAVGVKIASAAQLAPAAIVPAHVELRMENSRAFAPAIDNE